MGVAGGFVACTCFRRLCHRGRRPALAVCVCHWRPSSSMSGRASAIPIVGAADIGEASPEVVSSREVTTRHGCSPSGAGNVVLLFALAFTFALALGFPFPAALALNLSTCACVQWLNQQSSSLRSQVPLRNFVHQLFFTAGGFDGCRCPWLQLFQPPLFQLPLPFLPVLAFTVSFAVAVVPASVVAARWRRDSSRNGGL